MQSAYCFCNEREAAFLCDFRDQLINEEANLPITTDA